MTIDIDIEIEHLQKLKQLISQGFKDRAEPSLASIKQSLKMPVESKPTAHIVSGTEQSFKESLKPLVEAYAQQMVANVSHNAIDGSGKMIYVEPALIIKEALITLKGMLTKEPHYERN